MSPEITGKIMACTHITYFSWKINPHFSSDSPNDSWPTQKVRNLGPEMKDSFDVNPETKWSAEIDSWWLTEGPNFVNNESLAAIYWQGLLVYSVHQEEPQTELLASWIMPCSITPSESTIIREFQVLSFNQWTETFMIQSNTIISSFTVKPTYQNCSITTNQGA